MQVHLAYGRDGLDVELPDARTDVVVPHHPAALADPLEALRDALGHQSGARLCATSSAPASGWPSRSATARAPSHAS